jgi:hypothetical protein
MFRDLCLYSVPYRDWGNLRINLQRVVYTIENLSLYAARRKYSSNLPLRPCLTYQSRSEQISTLAGKKSSLTMLQARGLSWSEHYSFPLLSNLQDYGMPLQIANVSVHRWRYYRPFLRWVIFCSTKDGFITSLKIANVCCVNLPCTTGLLAFKSSLPNGKVNVPVCYI